MKCIIISLTVLFALAIAVLPPSNSYLPPPSSAGGNEYPKAQREQDFNAVPEIIATRNLDVNSVHDSSQLLGASTTFGANNGNDLQNTHDALNKIHKNGIRRTSLYNHGNNGILNSNHNQTERGYGRTSDNLGNGKHSLKDVNEGTDFAHYEERQKERAQGEYQVVLPDGRKQTVSYQAGERGYKPKISYDNTDEISRSGYDRNANNLSGNGYHSNGNNEDTDYHNNGNNGGVDHQGDEYYSKARSDAY